MSKKKKKSLKGKKLAAHTLRVEIKKLFKRNASKRFNAKQIIRKLKLDSINLPKKNTFVT